VSPPRTWRIHRALHDRFAGPAYVLVWAALLAAGAEAFRDRNPYLGFFLVLSSIGLVLSSVPSTHPLYPNPDQNGHRPSSIARSEYVFVDPEDNTDEFPAVVVN
jgi:hypothetical protein